MPLSRCSRRPDERHARSTALASAASRHACGGFPPVTVPLPAAPNRGSQTCHPACTEDDEAPDILAEHGEDRGAPCGGSQMNAEHVPISSAWELPHDLARRLTTILPAMTLAEALATSRIPRISGLTGRHTAVVTPRPASRDFRCGAGRGRPAAAGGRSVAGAPWGETRGRRRGS
jgi:hypothetical protein